ncbi:MAG TPA: hypothetical protein VE053_15525 [Allosphingosinicella sp.]|nr:hypothetical protein [Allosphingosinicella sp.]
MNIATGNWGSFPSREGMQRGSWVPIHFSPNPDTSERLVVAVVAVVGENWAIAEANALRRLNCLYGTEVVTAIVAIETGIQDLRARLTAEGVAALDASLVVSGLGLGEPQVGEASTASELAHVWLRAVSSVHDSRREAETLPVSIAGEAVDPVDHEIRRDRLPILVLQEIQHLRPALAGSFNRQIKLRAQNRDVRIKPQEVYIAFSGTNLVANFATLKVGRRKRTVDLSKRLMWDLEQHRRQDQGVLPDRKHEMLLYHPPKDDPELTERQYENLREVAEELSEQGRESGIGVAAYESVPIIARHVVSGETSIPVTSSYAV